MATDENTQNPFTRPSFIVAAIVIALVVVLGLTLAIINATRADPAPESQPTATAATATTEPSVAVTTKTSSNESVCGLGAGPDEVPVSAPEALWEYQGTIAYPMSKKYGPGAEDPTGFRYCFQHSPTGALFAAGNAVVQGAKDSGIGTWLEYFVAPGPHRQGFLEQGPGNGATTGVRINLEGFRILNYSQEAATIDVAVRGVAKGQTVYVSMVYTLVWADGDWKLDVADPANPINVANLPDTSGYIMWGE